MLESISIHSGLPPAIRLVAAHEVIYEALFDVSTTSRQRVGPYRRDGAAFTHPLPRGGTDFTIGHLMRYGNLSSLVFGLSARALFDCDSLSFWWARRELDYCSQTRSLAILKSHGALHYFEHPPADNYAKFIEISFSSPRCLFRIEDSQHVFY